MAEQEPNLASMPLGDHLEELRRRLILGLGGLLPICLVSLIFGKKLLEILIRPVQAALLDAGLPATLQQAAITETFSSYIRVSLIVTVIIGSPWLLWQIWRFVSPGLYQEEKRFAYLLIPMSAVLTFLGVIFLYLVIVPVITAFFIRFGSDLGRTEGAVVSVSTDLELPTIPVFDGDPENPKVGAHWINKRLLEERYCIGYRDGEPEVYGTKLVRGSGILQLYRIGDYVKLFMSLALAFAIGFQTPVVVLLLGWARIVDRWTLAQYRRYAVLASALLGAVLTPADPMSMILLGSTLFALYELGILLLRVLPPERVAKGIFKK